MKTASTKIRLEGWDVTQYRTVRDAILAIDLAVEAEPDSAQHLLSVAWTATVLLLQAGNGVPAPAWQPEMSRFHRLTPADLTRLREAIEMRMRAVERAEAA